MSVDGLRDRMRGRGKRELSGEGLRKTIGMEVKVFAE